MSDRQLDVEAIHERAKEKWISKRRRSGKNLLDRIEHSVPWWLIIIAAVMFALSAPHTTATFNQLTPGLGWLAPLGVEFGLLYAAFRRKRARQKGEAVPPGLWTLEILLFITAVIVNGAGSLTAVVSVIGIQNMSFADIFKHFGELPATSQVGLFLVVIAALIIPIGTGVTGEGLAALIYERNQSKDNLEMEWLEVERDELYRAFYVELLRRGFPPIEGKRQAAELSAGMTRGQIRTTRTAEPIHVLPDTATVSAAAVREPVRTVSRTDFGQEQTDSRTKVRQYLTDNPDAIGLSVRKLGEAAGVSKTIAAEVLSEFKQQMDGDSLA